MWGAGGQGSDLSLSGAYMHTHSHRCGSDAAAPSSNSYLLPRIASPSSGNALRMLAFREIGTFTILLHMLPSVQGGRRRGTERS